jgi:hypothetical protein
MFVSAIMPEINHERLKHIAIGDFSSGRDKGHSGGIEGAFRCKSVISAAAAGLLADPKWRFGGFSPVFCRTIQREKCSLCNKLP